jgi:hypothetical protein
LTLAALKCKKCRLLYNSFCPKFTLSFCIFINKNCRQTIVSTKDFVNHDRGKGQTAFSYKKRDSPFSPIICSSYFIEPMDWIFDRIQGELEGKIKCPTCQVKLGNFSWAGKFFLNCCMIF